MKSLKTYASLIVLAIAMAIPSFAQTTATTLTKYTSPDGTFSVNLPSTPTVTTKQATTEAGVTFTQNLFTADDSTDNLRIAIIEGVYSKAPETTAAQDVIAFNRASDAEVLASSEIQDGQMEIINANDMRALYLVIVRGNEVVQVLVATPKDSAVDSQVPIVQGIYQSLAFTAPVQSQN